MIDSEESRILIIDTVLKIPSWHSRSKETETTLPNENSDFNIR